MHRTQKYGSFLMVPLFIGLVYAIETGTTLLFGDQTLAPLLSILVCVGLVFINSPNLILLSIPVLAAETYWLIRDASVYPLVRTATMVLGGTLAYWLSLERKALENRMSEMESVLNTIPNPWILCDRSGNIIRLSVNASKLLPTKFSSVSGTSFFTLFSPAYAKGDLIKKFLTAADSKIPSNQVALNTPENPTVFMPAFFLPTHTKEGGGILVLFATNGLGEDKILRTNEKKPAV